MISKNFFFMIKLYIKLVIIRFECDLSRVLFEFYLSRFEIRGIYVFELLFK